MRLSLAIWNPSSGVHFVVVAMAIPALAQTTLFWASVPLPEMMLVNIWADSSIVCPLGFHFVTRDLRQNPLDLAPSIELVIIFVGPVKETSS
jgi:hypothetical protein